MLSILKRKEPSRYDTDSIDDRIQEPSPRALKKIHNPYHRDGTVENAYLTTHEPERLHSTNRQRLEGKAERLEEFYSLAFDKYGRAKMSAKQAADAMGLSTSTIYRYTKDLREITGDDGLAFSRRRLEDEVASIPERIRQTTHTAAETIGHYANKMGRAAALTGVLLTGGLAAPHQAQAPAYPQHADVFPAEDPEPQTFFDLVSKVPRRGNNIIEYMAEPAALPYLEQPEKPSRFTTWPVAGREPRITSLHGERDLSREYTHNRWSRNHPGIDIQGRPGDKVIALDDGTIRESTYGKVVIEYDTGWTCDNLHLRGEVKRGARVAQGDTIGTLIRPRLYHPHLHLACARESTEAAQGVIVRNGKQYVDASCLFQPELREQALARIIDGEYRPSGLRFREGQTVQEKLDQTCQPLQNNHYRAAE